MTYVYAQTEYFKHITQKYLNISGITPKYPKRNCSSNFTLCMYPPDDHSNEPRARRVARCVKSDGVCATCFWSQFSTCLFETFINGSLPRLRATPETYPSSLKVSVYGSRPVVYVRAVEQLNSRARLGRATQIMISLSTIPALCAPHWPDNNK